MNIRFLNPGEIDYLYPMLFKEAFGYEDFKQAPTTIIVSESSKHEIMAFLSGFMLDKYTFYIQYCGIIPQFRKRGIRFLEQGIAFLVTHLDIRALSTSEPCI